MAKHKAVTNEQIIAALLTEPTIEKAATAAGLSRRALYERMNEPEFLTEYAKAKADLVKGTLFALVEHSQQAVQTIAQIMQDEENKPQVRLQAAGMLLDNVGRYTKQLQAIETAANEEQSKQDSEGWLSFPI